MLSESKRELLERRLRGERVPGEDSVPAITPVGRDRRLPSSFGQRRLWFLTQLDPESVELNAALAVPWDGPLDVGVLAAALRELVIRHEVLRTRLVADADGEPYQVIDPPPAAVAVAVADVSGEPDPRAAAEWLVALEERVPFDLAAGAVLRASVVRVADDDCILVLAMHHVVGDEWSMRIIRRELGILYAAIQAGAEPGLPALEVQYADFAAWQREWLSGEVLESLVGYWRSVLAGAPVLELPLDRPRPPVPTDEGAVIEFTVPASVAEGLRAVAREAGASMFMTVLGVFTVLLSRYCGQDDVLVRTPVAGRNRAEVEGLVGFFVNALALRIDLSGDPSFAELLGRVRERVLGAQAHQDLPFEQLVDALGVERDRSRSPLGQVTFNYFTDDERDVVGAGSGVGGGFVVSGARVAVAREDLRLIVAESGGGLVGAVEYRSALFDEGRMVRLVGYLGELLGGVAADAGVRVSRLGLLPAGERGRVLGEWGRGGVAAGGGGWVPGLFGARVAAEPGAVAVRCGREWVSYGELDERSSRLAHYLRSCGVGAETVVGVCLPRGIEVVAVVLAVWKAGGAFLPLDPEYPAERLGLMLQQSRASLVVSAGGLADQLPAGRRLVVELDDPVTVAVVAGMPGDGPDGGVRGDGLAYVMFTSGSTGTPKGVQVTHGGLANLVAAQAPVFRVAAGAGALQFASFGFDAWVSEVGVALCAGAELVVASAAERGEAGALAGLVRDRGVRVATLPPSLLAVLEPGDLDGLETLVSAGERLASDVAVAWGGRHRLVNAYGPTEATVCATAGVFDASAGGEPAIGGPIGGAEAYVLDRSLSPVPAGVAGELFIGGAGVARGYAGRPELTAERFVASPFGRGARLYRSGDLARWRADGQLEFLGRADDQVKVRGFRIEPGEVEAVLRRHPAVADVVVTADGDGAARRLAAYVVLAGEAVGIPAGELRAMAAAVLPDYMIPGVFVELAAFPRTPGGKLDRAALPAPGQARPGAAAEPAVPRTPTEELLAQIWAGVLNLDQVSIHDDFFTLGGHSLLATRVVSRIKTTFGVEVLMVDLFDQPTVAGLAGVIDRTATTAQAPPIVPVDRDGRLPLSFGQQRLWFLAQLDPGSVEYNAPLVLPWDGPLDVDVLSSALGLLVARHEVLRTRLVAADDGIPYQVIDAPPARVPVSVADVSGAADPGAAAEWLVAVDARVPFDLAAGPLLRASVVRVGGDECIVMLAMHHVISDEWSSRIIRDELAALYRAVERGEEPGLAELAVQYADFAAWQRQWLSGEVLDGQQGYWRSVLAGAPVLELPADRPRPAVRSSEGAIIEFTVPAGVAEGLRAVSRSAGASMFMTVLAAFTVLLSRYSGQDDVVVGTPIAGRNRAEVEGLVGFFVNTLVLRADLSGDPTFAELLGRVRERALAAYAHQDLPFERLVDELAVERDRSRTPLFQVLFNYLTTLAGDPDDRLAGGQVSAPFASVAKYDLGLVLGEVAGGLKGAVEYSTALFDDERMVALVGHFRELLAAIAEDADTPLAQLPMLPARERDRLAEWGVAEAGLPAAGGVHELFEARVAAEPGAVAVVCDGVSLTYGEVDARASRLARYLRSCGVGAEAAVGVCLPRGASWVVAALAVWKAGGVYVPLDPEYPVERLRFMVAACGSRVVVGERAVAGGLAGDGVELVLLDDPVTAGRVAGESGAPLGVAVAAGQLAYVVFTSGSTGRPKGVGVSHHGAVNLAGAMAPAFGVAPGVGVLQFASFGFDAAVMDLVVVLSGGGFLVVASPGERAEPGLLARLIAGSGVAAASVSPSLLSVLDPGDVAGVSHWVVGSERVSGALADRWAGRARMTNAYGPTEASVIATTARCVAGGPGDPPIGSPLRGVEVHVLDRSLGLVPAGVAGELFIGGAGVARGYAGRPELTAERFVASPFGRGARLYRSGDLARWRADGQLEFLGRADQQVKVRGFRVEPAEVEAALRGHHGVADAVVAADGVGAGRRLVGYVVPAGPAGMPPAGELRAWVAAVLPEYMVPAVLVELAALPLTVNGKVDRAALPAPDGARPDLAGGYVAPRTVTEELLAGIWAEVLGVDQVGVLDDFFALGGHSLLATRVTAQARVVLGAEVTVAALFDARTVAGLAGAIGGAATTVVPQPIVPVDRDQPLPLSFAQQRLWFLAQLDPGSAEYNAPQAIPWHGPLDVGVLGRALGALVARHEVLRTRLVAADDGIPYQVIDAPPARVPVSVADVSGAADPGAAAEWLVAVDARVPFDLAAGPLLRASVVRVGGDECIVMLAMHHVISDEWSSRIIRDELAALYRAVERGEEPGLAELAVQYADFAAWQRQWLSGEVLDGQLGYWRSVLAGAPVLELPADRPRPAVRSSEGAIIEFTVPAGVAEGLRAVSRSAGASMFMTVLAAFTVLLSRYSGQDDVVVGTPIAGRNRAEVEGLVGFFVNTLVLRADLSGDPTFAELLGRVRERALAAYAHQDLPFERLVDELAVERDRSRTPLFQVLFNYLTTLAGDPDDRLAGGQVSAPFASVAKYDLGLVLGEVAGGLKGAVEYSTALFDDGRMVALVGHFRELLAAIAEDADTPLAQLPMLPARERDRLILGWNETDLAVPAVSGVGELVRAWAERSPERLAVTCGTESLTYAELESRVGHLARQLRWRGVGAETVVGLCLSRGVDLVVAALAVWRAGGAYLPLDPDYPGERLRFMLADSGASVLLGHRAVAGQLAAEVDESLWLDDPVTTVDEDLGPVRDLDASRAAYLLYTSGSTGQPKGVVISQQSLLNLLATMGEHTGCAESDVLLAVTTIGFDIAGLELFLPLVSGGRLVVASRQTAQSPRALAAEIERAGATMMQATPATWQMLLDDGWPGSPELRVLCGGEALPGALATQIASRTARMWNVYGPTETTIWSSCQQVVAGGEVTLGRPIGNTQMYVLDRSLNPVPVGVAGELFIGGAGLARGYRDRPELTAERFVADRFSGAGARLYRTGDLVRWRADGELEFLGRADQQVKIRGFRIEPGEVEAVLRRDSRVGTAVVVAVGSDGERRLAAYLVPADPASGLPPVAQLREMVRGALPEYMVPSVMVELAALPLTPNGKIDRAALPAPGHTRADLADRYRPPRTSTERLLAGIWCDLLELDQVGIGDDFFELGGHSLLATRMMNRIRATCGVDLVLAAIFDQPAIEPIAAAIDAARPDIAGSDTELEEFEF